jgi:tetratricopeptide (TPR) repeat protein
MNTRFFILVLLAGGLLGARADTVRLKTGETIEGTILSETNAIVTIEVEHAGGTILATQTFRKDEIAEIRRSTPEEIAQRNMERAFASTQKYRLDPKTSYSPDYYRLVIDGALRKFLTDYPDSPYTNVVAAQLRQWVAEQEMVSKGMAKFNGRWMSAAEAARQNAETRFRAALDRGKTYLAQGQFPAAVEQFNAALPLSPTANDQAEARRLTAETFQRWAESLERQRTRLNADIQRAEDRLARAQTARAQAEQRAASAGDVHRLGTEPHVLQARVEQRAAEGQLAQLRNLATTLDRQIADVRTRMGAPTPSATATAGDTTRPSAAGAAGVAVAPAAETPAAGSAAQKDIVNQIGELLSRYWVVGLAVVVLMAWGCVYIFTRE